MREVSVRTEYTEANMLKFFKFNIFSRNKAVVIGFIVVYAVLFAFNIYNIVFKLMSGIKLGASDFIAVAVLVFCSYWIYSRFFIMPKKLAKHNSGSKTLVSDVTVSDEGISVYISDSEGSDLRTKSYAYILDKNGCTKGSAEGIRALFTEHCTKKQFKNGTHTASVKTEEDK